MANPDEERRAETLGRELLDAMAMARRSPPGRESTSPMERALEAWIRQERMDRAVGVNAAAIGTVPHEGH